MWLLSLVLLAFLIYYFWARKYIFVNKGRTDIEKINREFIVDQLGYPDEEYPYSLLFLSTELKEHYFGSHFVYKFNRHDISICVGSKTLILNKIKVTTKDTVTKEVVQCIDMNMVTLKEYMKQVKDYV